MCGFIRKELDGSGYVFLSKYMCGKTTEEIAAEIGDVFRVSDALLDAYVSGTQVLNPRDRSVGMRNTYSDEFGLDAFPYHTDLAHWYIPPRYLLLRCIKGAKEVATNLISSRKIIEQLNRDDLEKAIFRTRRKSINISPSLCTLRFEFREVQGLRWDSLFLLPMNSYAENIKNVLNNIDLRSAESKVFLLDFGDTLLIDNWSMLHGRSLVPESARSREVERMYLSNLRE